MRRWFKQFIYSVYFGTSKTRQMQSKVSIHPAADWRTVFAPHAPSAIAGERPSRATRQFLARNDFGESCDEPSKEFLLSLNARVSDPPDPHLLLALAELCYLRAKRTPSEESMLLLSCAYYAYRLLFGSDDPGRLAFSPGFRLSCELYNHALGNLVGILAERRFPFSLPATVGLLAGKLEFTRLSSELPWRPDSFDAFHSAYDFRVKGFHVEWRAAGLGAPIIASRNIPDDRSGLPWEERFLPQVQSFPLTGLLRFDLSRPAALAPDGTVTADIELHDAFISDTAMIAGRNVPLELNISTVLAYALARNKLRFKNIDGLLDPQPRKHFIFTVSRMREGRIPVVFVHGLVSTPRAWDQMVNLLMSNPIIRKNYQFFMFAYPSGNPLVVSSVGLRESLLRVRRELDPGLSNPCFDRMVLVGHSMGGLLSKFMLLEGGDEIFTRFFGKPLAEIDMDDESKEFLRRFLDFHPLPFVKRCVFIASPHRGSDFAKNSFSRFSSSLIEYSDDLRRKAEKALAQLASNTWDEQMRRKLKINTGIEGVGPDNIMLDIMEHLPMNPQVKCHSIIGNVKEAGKPGTDTIVESASAHVDYAVSELIVKSDHSAHRALAGILEVERILLEHLKENGVG